MIEAIEFKLRISLVFDFRIIRKRMQLITSSMLFRSIVWQSTCWAVSFTTARFFTWSTMRSPSRYLYRYKLQVEDLRPGRVDMGWFESAAMGWSPNQLCTIQYSIDRGLQSRVGFLWAVPHFTVGDCVNSVRPRVLLLYKYYLYSSSCTVAGLPWSVVRENGWSLVVVSWSRTCTRGSIRLVENRKSLPPTTPPRSSYVCAIASLLIAPHVASNAGKNLRRIVSGLDKIVCVLYLKGVLYKYSTVQLYCSFRSKPQLVLVLVLPAVRKMLLQEHVQFTTCSLSWPFHFLFSCSSVSWK